jgi:hypothetical protein
VAFEIIGDEIRGLLISIKVPVHEVRRPGVTRLEALKPLLEEIGIEILEADRVMIIPSGDDTVIVRFYDFGEATDAPRQRRGVAENETAEGALLATHR